MDAGNAASPGRSCPHCGADTVPLPLFAGRRRSPVTCTGCGTKLERVLPGAPYYTLSFLAALMLEAALPLALLLALLRQWMWIAVIVLLLVAFNLATSAFLNSRTRIEYENIEDARRDVPGRWYPK